MTETDTKLHWHDSAIKKAEWWWPKIPSKEIHYWMVWKLKSIGKGKKVWFAKCKMSYFEEEPSFWFPPLPYQWLKDLVRKQQIGFAFSPQDPQQTCYCMWRVEIGLHLTFSAKFNQQLSWIESKQARKRGFESNQRKNQSFTEWLNFTQSIPTLFPKSSLSLLDRKTDMKSFADPQKCFTLLNK